MTYNVVSLFNGMNTLRQAMENVGMKVGNYYSSEIKTAALKLTQHHYPDTVQLGNIENWKEWDIDWSNIDLIGSGSPCQDLSIAGKGEGLSGNKSRLFWFFIEILNHVRKLNPNVLFLQENVGSANVKDVGIMSRAMGIYPAQLNSSLVTAQLRDRYYWTNIRTREDGFFGDVYTDIPQPKDRKIMYQDIIENGFILDAKSRCLLESEAKTYGYKNMDKFTSLILKRLKAKKQIPNLVYSFVDRDKARAILESESRTFKNLEKQARRYLKTGFGNIVYFIENGVVSIRHNTKIELCRLQGFRDDYCDIISRNQAASLLGDGWSLPMIEHILSFVDE